MFFQGGRPFSAAPMRGREGSDWNYGVAEAISALDATIVSTSAVSGFGPVGAIDLTDYLCTGDTCHSVIGNALVYADGYHMTSVYSATLAPAVARGLNKPGWQRRSRTEPPHSSLKRPGTRAECLIDHPNWKVGRIAEGERPAVAA
jgi:hypothetical protein